jgi:hypothetical protein
MAIQKSGYVALLDVLGFSDRVMRGGFADLDAYIKTVLQVTDPNPSIGTILFSDTVVLYTFDDSEPAFGSLVAACSNLFHDLVMAGVPVRGAISHGDFVRSEHDGHGTVIAGRPIIEAHHYESRLQWIGIMLTPSVLEHADVSANRCALNVTATMDEPERFTDALIRLGFQPCASIPLEDRSGEASEFEGFAIVPMSLQVRSIKDMRDSIEKVGRRLERLKQLAPDARSQAKYQRTIVWLRGVSDLLRKSAPISVFVT